MLNFFHYLEIINDFIWSEYLSIPLILVLGFYLTLQSRFLQLTSFHTVLRTFLGYFRHGGGKTKKGIHPLKVFFTSVGGCIGVGNIVGICEALKYGGPGALFWVWVTGLVGMILKYTEVYLGMKFRVSRKEGGYDGGPMYYLQRAFRSPFLKTWVPRLACLLLCIYGIEIYFFSVITITVVENLQWNHYAVTALLFVIVMTTVKGGMERVANVSGAIIPVFISLFSLMSIAVIAWNIHRLSEVIQLVMHSAFTGHAAIGGFGGAALAQTISYGIKRSCYSGDVGIGYASIVHSESKEIDPRRQASLAIFGIFLDTFVVCSFSVLVVLFTNTWQEPIEATHYVQHSLSMYFGGMQYFWPLFIFILGFSTIITFFAMGMKAAHFLWGDFGKRVYYYFAGLMFLFFSFYDSSKALLIMELSGGSLLIINLIGFFLLRKEIEFKVPKKL